ncbi:MAG TPA: hypothetical protein PLZ16_12960 [Gammaproteobacteria bacterium]|nr:hypothetical protein [Gammaproteobacteria bacterium]
MKHAAAQAPLSCTLRRYRMVVFALLALAVVIAFVYYLYQNHQDKKAMDELLRRTQAEDEAEDKKTLF